MYNRIYTTRTLDITTKWQHVKLNVGRILYVIMQKQDAEIHLYGGKIYTTRITCGELKEQLGEDFLEIRRGCLVSAITIQNITETGIHDTPQKRNYPRFSSKTAGHHWSSCCERYAQNL